MAKKFSSEELVTRWEDRREIQNLMGRFAGCFMLKRENDIFDSFWSHRDDISLGLNNGYYDGAEAVKGFHDALSAVTVRETQAIKKAFPDKLADKTVEEIHGIGVIEIKPLDTCVIEIADDRETAKGIWYSRGTYSHIEKAGPVSYWRMGCFAVDFINENDQWKLWHVLNFEDVNSPCGSKWGVDAEAGFPVCDRFSDYEPVEFPAPNKPAELHRSYDINRPFTELPRLPEPYSTFGETFSYGI